MKWNVLEYIPALSVTQSRMFCCTELHHWVDFSRPFFKLFPSFPFSFMLSGQAPLPLGWSSHTVWVCSSAHSEVHKLFVTQEARTLEGEIVSVCVKSIWTMYEKRPYSSREWHWFSMTREGAVTLEAHFDKKHTHTHSWGWQGVCLGCLVRSAMHYCLRSPLRSTSCLPRKERRERILSPPPTHTQAHSPFYCAQWRKGPVLYRAQSGSCVFLLSATSHTHTSLFAWQWHYQGEGCHGGEADNAPANKFI